jgi:beta-1,4-N-acetylglucosaminyltransferase
MILVTVGTHNLGFERLIKKMDFIASRIDEEVIMQIGYTSFTPIYAQYFDFKSFQEMQQLIKEARVVICHGGAGTILSALAQETHVIAVPRVKEYNEILFDHQFDLVDALVKDKRIIAVYDLETLEKVLCTLPKKLDKKRIKDDHLVNFLKKYLNSLEK